MKKTISFASAMSNISTIMKNMGFACLLLLLVTACKKDDGPRKEAEKN